jgi:uncharacterized protein (TIGR00251 family)
MKAVARREDGLSVALLVVPGASREKILGEHDGRLRVAVTAPPEAGAANKAALRLLASALGVRRSAVTLERGAGSRRKTVHVLGVEVGDAVRRLERATS